MERLTERDEFGNANIIEVDSEEFQLSLDFDDFNRVTNALNKLAEYEDLAEQGKLLKLPCALGDTVYATFGGKVSKQIVRGILFRENKILAQDGNGSILGEFGEDVFFTWEESEAALKEL